MSEPLARLTQMAVKQEQNWYDHIQSVHGECAQNDCVTCGDLWGRLQATKAVIQIREKWEI